MVILSSLDRPLSIRDVCMLICKVLLSFSSGILSKGDLHSWNSLKALPDMPSATYHVNGKGGLEASQVPYPQPCQDDCIDCRV